jgi:hypothetical protein
MPKLDIEQEQRARQWLRERHALAACPGCERSAWSFGEIVIAPTPTDEPGSPMLQVVCHHCSFITFYAAAPMGLTVS